MDYNNYHPITDMDPEDNWLRRVQKGSPIYLVKENTFAYVEWEYDPRRTGYCGHIGLRFDGGYQDSWYIQGNGTGIDGSQCLYPVQGFLLEKETELPLKYLDDLTRRVQKLEEIVLFRSKGGGKVIDVDYDLADMYDAADETEEDVYHLRRELT